MSTRSLLIAANIHIRGKVTKVRRYSKVVKAFPKAVEILLMDGNPGDTVELTNHDFGFEIGCVKVHVGGRISVDLKDLED